MNERDSNPSGRFVVCIQSHDGGVDLQARKLSERLPDPDAERMGYVRMIDDSGEDYLYPGNCFLEIEISKDLEESIRRAC